MLMRPFRSTAARVFRFPGHQRTDSPCGAGPSLGTLTLPSGRRARPLRRWPGPVRRGARRSGRGRRARRWRLMKTGSGDQSGHDRLEIFFMSFSCSGWRRSSRTAAPQRKARSPPATLHRSECPRRHRRGVIGGGDFQGSFQRSLSSPATSVNTRAWLPGLASAGETSVVDRIVAMVCVECGLLSVLVLDFQVCLQHRLVGFVAVDMIDSSAA